LCVSRWPQWWQQDEPLSHILIWSRFASCNGKAWHVLLRFALCNGKTFIYVLLRFALCNCKALYELFESQKQFFCFSPDNYHDSANKTCNDLCIQWCVEGMPKQKRVLTNPILFSDLLVMDSCRSIDLHVASLTLSPIEFCMGSWNFW
jgi:hypothetical protein